MPEKVFAPRIERSALPIKSRSISRKWQKHLPSERNARFQAAEGLKKAGKCFLSSLKGHRPVKPFPGLLPA
ncbi:MAG TPA: hypothetical protein H9684_00150 [Firmicutes bacterium]|nr:hypothetical protein [Bacillota bacterium]